MIDGVEADHGPVRVGAPSGVVAVLVGLLVLLHYPHCELLLWLPTQRTARQVDYQSDRCVAHSRRGVDDHSCDLRYTTDPARTELNRMDFGTRKTRVSRSRKTVPDCPI